MATKSAPPPAPSAPADSQFDELTGVYGFFRRHQKKLLYTAGLFTLLTFSITGPMQALVADLFGKRQPLPTIAVNGERVSLTEEDYEYGRQLSRNYRLGLPQGVLLPIDPGEGGQGDLTDSFAILRRAAIAEGFEVSMDEVDIAIEAARKQFNAESPQKLARDRGFASLGEYRNLVAEGMRIGLYMRLQLLALDTTDARALQDTLADREKITMRVATFDEKAHEESLRQASQLTDDDLRTWFDAKNEVEKMRMQAYGLPRAQLQFVGFRLGYGATADGQPDPNAFDPAQWQDDILKDYTVGDDELKQLYEQEKERFRIADAAPEVDPYRTLDDEAVRAEVVRIAQAQHVVDQLLTKLRERQNEVLKPLSDELLRTQREAGEAEAMVRDLERQLEARRQELADRQAAAAAQPDDEALRTAVAETEAAIQKLDGELFAARDVVPAKKAAATEAETALKTGRTAFDLRAEFATLTAGKQGVVAATTDGVRTAEELKDLDALGLDLGTWPQSQMGARLQNQGDLGSIAARTSKAVLLYQALATEPRPLKPWDELKPLIEGAYWTEKARAVGQEKQQAMEQALLRLGKERIPEFVAEREASLDKRIEERMAEWRKGVEADIQEAKDVLARPNLGKLPGEAWRRKLADKERELAAADLKQQQFREELQKTIEAEIAAEAQKKYGEVLDAAAAEVGFELRNVGPYPRNLQERPRFDQRYDPTEVFLFRSQSELDAGEATGVLHDPGNRRYHVAVVTGVEPLTPADVTRREYEALRTGYGFSSFGTIQLDNALRHAFTREVLEQRYDLERPVGRQVEAEALAPK